MAKNTWALGDAFSMADCAACPALNQVNMMGGLAKFRHVEAYYNRLRERPSFARVLQEAAPFWAQFAASQKK
jgi:glutathione S-transferase